jgi:hypothetical protein
MHGVYRTLVFLDSDMTVRSNIDELFCFDTFAVSKIFNCFPPTDKICQNLNSGILVIKPDTELFADIMQKYPTTYSYNSGDQGFLTTYFADKPKSYINNRVYNVKIKIKDNKPCTPDIVTALQDPVRTLNQDGVRVLIVNSPPFVINYLLLSVKPPVMHLSIVWDPMCLSSATGDCV